MIRKSQIPDIAVAELVFFLDGKVTREKARAAITYMLNAWPDSSIAEDTTGWDRHIELPIK